MSNCAWGVYRRIIGPKRALEMLLTGEPLGPQQAWQMGLMNRVVPRADVTPKGWPKKPSNVSWITMSGSPMK
jgi:enoyl-CoA hydratase/carnithine racemase